MLFSLNPLTNISSCHPKSIGPIHFRAIPMLSLAISYFSQLRFFKKSIGGRCFRAIPMLLSLNPLTNISSCHPKSIGPIHFRAIPMLSLDISCFSQLRFLKKSIGGCCFLAPPMLFHSSCNSQCKFQAKQALTPPKLAIPLSFVLLESKMKEALQK